MEGNASSYLPLLPGNILSLIDVSRQAVGETSKVAATSVMDGLEDPAHHGVFQWAAQANLKDR
jgi:hypothetical protein